MEFRKEIPTLGMIAGCAIGAYVAGQHLEYSKAPAKQMVTVLAGTTSTSSVAVVLFNPTTFAEIHSAPPVVPPGDRQQQG